MVAINSQVGLHPDEIARRSFATSRKGYDPEAVRQFLDTVAGQLQAALDREQALRRKLAEAERRAAEPELDEATLMRAVGAETARILQAAHDAASEVGGKAESRAAEIIGQAEAVLSERQEAAEAEAAAIVEAARAGAETVTEGARAEAVALLEATRHECRRIVREARQMRNSILSDLAERRRGLRVQLEELRAGRDFLVEVVDAVQLAAVELRQRVANAEHEARLAAAAAGEQAEASDDVSDLAVVAVIEEASFPAGVVDESALEEAAEGVGSLSSEPAERALYDEAGEQPLEEPPDGGASSRRSVDELFARIRAGREAAEEPAQGDQEELEAVSGGDPGAEDDVAGATEEGAARGPEAVDGLPEEEEGVLGQHSAHEAAVEEVDDAPETHEPEVLSHGATSRSEAGQPVGEGQDEAPGGEDDPDAVGRARRSELLDPLQSKLSRALKRALQDDQNVLLDAIRHSSGMPDLAVLLPAEGQRARLEAAAAGLLAEAWAAGHAWLGDKTPEPSDAEEAGRRLASELASEVSELLRHRLGESLGRLGEAGEGAADAAGAAYREWRGKRVERTAGDYGTKAFSDGVVTGGTGRLVRWVVDDEGQPCPDCDDNTLAGSLSAGEEFPTGHVYPPVHSGCRCLLVAVSS